MSVEEVGKALQEFLSGTEPKAIALTGRWGTGKTHFWEQQITKYLETANDPLAVAYVSLFGLNSISDVKDAIFEKTEKYSKYPLDKKIWKKEVNKELTESIYKSGENTARKFFPYALKIPVLSQIGAFAKASAFQMVGKQVICLDDLERKGEQLDPKDIFGLVNMLKERKKCKVIVIFNDDALGENQEAFEAHREKVFDFEIRFSPNSKECCDIAYSGLDASLSHIAECSQMLNITNIRILYRIRSVAEYFAPLCAGYHPDIMTEALRAAALLTWAYNKDPAAPPYAAIKSMELGWPRFFAQDELEIFDAPAIKKTLEDYPYTSTDNMDLQVCHYLENGFIDKDSFDKAIQDKNIHYSSVESQNRIEALVDMFRGSFEDDENAYITEAEKCVALNGQWIEVGMIHHLIGIMRALGKDDIASKMIATWVKSKKNNPDHLNLNNYHWRRRIKDQELIDAMAIANAKTIVELTTEEVADRLLTTNNWDDCFFNALSKVTEDDLYNLFKTTHGKTLQLYILAFDEIRKEASHPEMQNIDIESIYQSTRNVLNRIAAECTINQVRFDWLYSGTDPDD